MSVGILPGMASYSGNTPAIASDQQATAQISAGLAAPGLGTAGSKLSFNLGADNSVAQTILVFALLWFGVVFAAHQIDRLG